MENRSIAAALALGATLAAGIIVAGYLVADSLYKIRAAERYVTVKGLAERSVAADLVIWPLNFSQTGNELSVVQQQLEKDRDAIRRFLIELGFRPEDISDSPPRITDFLAQGYTAQNMPPNRYKADAAVTLSSGDVPSVKKAMERSGELVRSGIVLSTGFGPGAQFLFTGLNTIKPEMIAEATDNARKAAEQFARDSGSRVGAIRKASQGLFTISDRDVNSPDLKIVRVVTSVEYFLVDR